MKRLCTPLILLTLAIPALFGQTGPGPVNSSTTAQAPSGTTGCPSSAVMVDRETGAHWACVSGTWTDILPPGGTECNIEDYGAIAGDNLDDTDEIQAAIDAVVAGTCDSVYIPCGEFDIDAPCVGNGCLEINDPNITIWGEGACSFIDHDDDTTGDGALKPIFYATGLADYLVIHSIRINSNRAAGAGAGGSHMIDVRGTVGGADLQGLRILNNRFGQASRYTLDLDGLEDAVISNNRMEWAANAHIHMTDAKQVRVTNNYLTKSNKGVGGGAQGDATVSIESNSNNVPEDVVISDNGFNDSEAMGIKVWRSATASATGISITGNVFRDYPIDACIECSAKYCTVTGNSMEGCGKGGILVDSVNEALVDGVIDGNVIKDASQASNGTYAGIILRNAVGNSLVNFVVSGNIISGPTTKTAIEVDDALNNGGFDGLVFSGNSCRECDPLAAGHAPVEVAGDDHTNVTQFGNIFSDGNPGFFVGEFGSTTPDYLVIRSDGSTERWANAAADTAFAAFEEEVSGGTFPRWKVQGNGSQKWSDGDNTFDVALFRRIAGSCSGGGCFGIDTVDAGGGAVKFCLEEDPTGGSQGICLDVPATDITSDITWTLPEAVGGANCVWTSDASGNLTCPTGASPVPGASWLTTQVKNATGGTGTMSKAAPVYATGVIDGTCNCPEVDLADADNPSAMPAIGILTDDLTDGSTGYVLISGMLTDVDTSSYSPLDDLHVDITPGQFSVGRPTTVGTEVQKVGNIIRSDVSAGSILVTGSNWFKDVPNDVTDQAFYVNMQSGLYIGDGTAADQRLIFRSDTEQDIYWDDAPVGLFVVEGQMEMEAGVPTFNFDDTDLTPTTDGRVLLGTVDATGGSEDTSVDYKILVDGTETTVSRFVANAATGSVEAGGGIEYCYTENSLEAGCIFGGLITYSGFADGTHGLLIEPKDGASTRWRQTLAPYADNLYDLGTSTLRIAMAYFMRGMFEDELVVDDLGIEFAEGDTLTDCSTFASTGGGIFYDDSEGIFKKCQDNVLSDMDTTGGGLSLSGVTDGQMLYDNSDALGGVPQMTFDGTNVTIDLLSEDSAEATLSVIEVWNDSGATIHQCAAVYISGTNAGPPVRPTIAVADADTAAEMPALGLVQADIANGAAGFVVVSGVISSLDTSTGEVWSEGDALYVENDNTTTASGDCGETLTSTKPTGAADLIQAVARVVRANAALGQLVIQGAGRTNDVPNAITIGASDTINTDSVTLDNTWADAQIESAIARLASPTFTGTPAAPTAVASTDTTQIATTAFVKDQERTVCKVIEDLVAADDDVPLFYFNSASTIIKIGCDSQAAATVSVQDGGGTDVDADLVCSTGGSITWDSSLSGTTSFTDGERLEIDTISESTPSWTTICFAYTTP